MTMPRPWNASTPPTDRPTVDPSIFDCASSRHKVITNDGICCLCGARDVIDARRLPTAL